MAQKTKFFELIRPNHNYNFVGKGKWLLGLSVALVLLSLALLPLNHFLPGRKHALNLSTEFRGGTELWIDFHQDVGALRIKSALEEGGIPDVEAAAVSGQKTPTYAVRFPVISTFSEEQRAKLKTLLTKKLGGTLLRDVQFKQGNGTLVIVVANNATPLTAPLVSQKDAKVTATPAVSATTLEAIRSTLQEMGFVTTEAKQFSTHVGKPGETQINIELGTIQKAVRAALEAKLGAGVVKGFRASSSFGAKASEELRTNGIISLLAAIGFIMLYILIRFDFRYAPGTVLALLHDAVLVLGAFALTYKEFSLTTIAALLTVIGYSMNDTIVVFDRIRENVAKYKDRPFRQVVNLSINETLSRTILTSLTVFFVTLSMNIFGTGVIRDFGFAMNIGVIVGTYSSIFVASPVLIWLHERSKPKTRR